MERLKVKLHWKQVEKISELLKYEERRVIRRCNILSCLHNGMGSSLIAKVLHVDPKTVRNVAHAFLEKGLDSSLYDDERSGRPIDIDDKDRSRIIAMVCTEPPKGYYRWTLDLIVDEAKKREDVDVSLSREQVRIILQEHDLKPWREKMWCVPKLDEEYIDKMEDVLDVYARPYNEEKPVVCVDEKSVQLLSDKRAPIPAKEGSEKKIDFEYKRNGTANVFIGVEPLIGSYLNKVTERRCSCDFAAFLQDVEKKYVSAEKIVLVMDNLSTHTEKSLLSSLGDVEGKRLWERFEVHYTPKHASWLNQAEIAIGMYSRQCLGHGRVQNILNLKAQTTAWNARTNKIAPKIQWRFTKSKARKSFKYDRISNE